MILMVPLLAMTLGGAVAAEAPGQARERAQVHYQIGMEHMRDEAYGAAIEAFTEAVAIDETHALAHYMIGRAHMARQNYEEALAPILRARQLFQGEANRQFTTRAEAERHWRTRLTEIDAMLSRLRGIRNPNYQILDQIRQLEELKRQIQSTQRSTDLTGIAVPGFVLVSLGSTYFRLNSWADAEDAFRAALAVDPRLGEAHNNLAVVCMETGRYDEAERFVRSAEKVGFRVPQGLKEEIKRRRAGG